MFNNYKAKIISFIKDSENKYHLYNVFVENKYFVIKNVKDVKKINYSVSSICIIWLSISILENLIFNKKKFNI